MNIPPEAWTSINTFGLVLIAVLSFLNNRKQAQVSKQVEGVKEIVDGPLSLALKNNAELAQRLAEKTGNKQDQVAAIRAAIIHENRMEGKTQ